MNWDVLFKTLGSTAIVVAVLGFLAKTIVEHFFNRAIKTHENNLKQAADEVVESHKADLKRAADLELADLKRAVDLELAGEKARTEQELTLVRARSDRELAELKDRTERDLAQAKARADAAMLAQKADFDRQLATFQTELATRTARADRIRAQIVHWANPILGAVVDLTSRLRNILDNEGYLALSPETQGKISADWSIRYDYFLPSTVYLFCQYFCWVRLLEESLSFELFEKHEAKDSFIASIRAAGSKLSVYPLEELRDIPRGGDHQVFNLQQRALGEAVTVGEGAELRCMRYSEFLLKWADSAFKPVLDPMTRFVDQLQPTNEHRWKRLELMVKALGSLHDQCKMLLAPKTAQE